MIVADGAVTVGKDWNELRGAALIGAALPFAGYDRRARIGTGEIRFVFLLLRLGQNDEWNQRRYKCEVLEGFVVEGGGVGASEA